MFDLAEKLVIRVGWEAVCIIEGLLKNTSEV